MLIGQSLARILPRFLPIPARTQLSRSVQHLFPNFVASKSKLLGSRFSSNSVGSKDETKFEPKKSNKDLFGLGGYRGVLDNLADVVRYLQNPSKYTELGIQHPKGVILSGPPGVGKTHIAEAVSGHAGVPIIIISGPEIESTYVGESEKKLRDLFKQAQSISPCVVCIDEFDSIAAKRLGPEGGSRSTHYINSIVNQLLSLLSQDHPGVVVITTTNNYDMLDPAIVRPGRFDRHIALSLPNCDERKEILEIHTKNKQLSHNISIRDLAALSSGFSGAKLAGWVNEAAVFAAREGSSAIEIHHFDAARTLINQGVLTKGATDPLQKLASATHETGHAMVGHLLNLKLYKISTHQYGNSKGVTEWIMPDTSRNLNKQELLNLTCMLLAGRAAEILFSTPAEGSENDLLRAKELAHNMVYKEAMGATICGSMMEVEALLQQEMNRATSLIKEHQKTCEQVRDALVEREEIFQTDFVKVIAGEKLPQKIRQKHETRLVLPPKARHRIHADNSRLFPLTNEEVAEAIRVNPDSIRIISKNNQGGVEITFKPSFKDSDHLYKISEELSKNDVENKYYEGINELLIKHYGVPDFIKFVKSRRS